MAKEDQKGPLQFKVKLTSTVSVSPALSSEVVGPP